MNTHTHNVYTPAYQHMDEYIYACMHTYINTHTNSKGKQPSDACDTYIMTYIYIYIYIYIYTRMHPEGKQSRKARDTYI